MRNFWLNKKRNDLASFLARAYCRNPNAEKVLDGELIFAIADAVIAKLEECKCKPKIYIYGLIINGFAIAKREEDDDLIIAFHGLIQDYIEQL